MTAKPNFNPDDINNDDEIPFESYQWQPLDGTLQSLDSIEALEALHDQLAQPLSQSPVTQGAVKQETRITDHDADSASYYLNLGTTHYNSFLTRAKNKDLDIAINCFRRALETNPELSEGYVKLGTALFDKGEVSAEEAVDYCKKALQINPKNSEANLFLGYFFTNLGRIDDAQQEFESAMKKDPLKSAKARMAFGKLLIQKANYEQARGKVSTPRRLQLVVSGLMQFTAGVCLLPVDRRTWNVLNDALVTDLKIYSILSTAKLAHTFKLNGLRKKLYEMGVKSLPEEALFYHLMGNESFAAGQTDAAIYYYQRAQEIDPENTDVAKNLSRCYSNKQDDTQAKRALEKVVSIDEAVHNKVATATDFDSVYELAQLYVDGKEYMKALYYFKELVAEHPENPYVRSNMAYVLFRLEDIDGAVKHYEKAVEYGEDPVWTATVAQTLGTIYHQVRHDLDSAVGMFQLAYQLDESNLESIVMLADLYMEQGNYDAAIGAYRFILNFEPENADCHNYLGYLLWQIDENDEAIESYRKAITFDPDNAIAHNNLGVVYLDEKCQPEPALEMFRKASYLNENYTLAQFNVGRAYEAIGERSKAAKAYSSALSLNTFNPEMDSDEIQDRLEHLFTV